MKNLDYIFLDLDGPLLEGKYRHYKCYEDIVRKYGGETLSLEIYWELKRAKVPRNIILSLSKFNGSYFEFLDEWGHSIEDRKYLALDTLKPDVKMTLRYWQTISDKIVIVTMRQNRKHLIEQLINLEIFSLVDEVIDCPPQRKNTKYEALRAKSFKKAVFIGDTEEDINAAKMLGIKSIGITNGLRNKELLNTNSLYEEIKDIKFSEKLLND